MKLDEMNGNLNSFSNNTNVATQVLGKLKFNYKLLILSMAYRDAGI